jgi:hypothetical protein
LEGKIYWRERGKRGERDKNSDNFFELLQISFFYNNNDFFHWPKNIIFASFDKTAQVAFTWRSI